MVQSFVILLNMFVARASLNHSFSGSVSNSFPHSAWRWLAAHILYSLFFSAGINSSVDLVSYFINFRELFANPSVHYNQELEGYERGVAIERGCHRLKSFLQLIALTFTYTLGAYYYKSVVCSTPVD